MSSSVYHPPTPILQQGFSDLDFLSRAWLIAFGCISSSSTPVPRGQEKDIFSRIFIHIRPEMTTGSPSLTSGPPWINSCLNENIFLLGKHTHFKF
ncbi:hypothetical protein Y1Q_0018847 [Alligator mississippiensis]|uniref:Uncharacterized protein n=1 Tax=Alligator mississippiensis TaxID=8496 RepID=A0A151N5N6_ALLMI|nr:hypothetical protein Y1Q_0018847 [Alligator mississippiensis]